MATQFVHAAPRAPLSFMLRDALPAEPSFAAAFHAAVRAERSSGARSPSQRVARLLCEIGKRLGCEADLPLTRAALAGALGVSLVRVKRTLGLLCLSGVLDVQGERIRVIDWRKLAGAARFDPAALGVAEDEEEASRRDADDTPCTLTAGGDQACFV